MADCAISFQPGPWDVGALVTVEVVPWANLYRSVAVIEAKLSRGLCRQTPGHWHVRAVRRREDLESHFPRCDVWQFSLLPACPVAEKHADEKAPGWRGSAPDN